MTSFTTPGPARRLGDLNPAMLRTESARAMTDFAETLYRDSGIRS